MDIVDCIEGRRSVRVFRSDPVEDAVVDKALELANLAPSAGNLQARGFIVVRDDGTKRLLKDAAFGQDFVRTAPVVVVFCADLDRIDHYGDRGRALYCIQDVAAAVENMMLYLHSKGLGTVWVGAFDERKAAEAVGLPGYARPVAIVPIGYPAEEGLRRKRLPVGLLVHRERW